MRSGLRQTKPFELDRPFGGSITQVRHADAARKPTLDGSLDQTRRDKCHRDGHVDVANAALVTGGNLFDGFCAGDDRVEPRPAAGD